MAGGIDDIDNRSLTATIDKTANIKIGDSVTITTTGTSGIYIAGRNKGAKIDASENPNKNVYSPLNIDRQRRDKRDRRQQYQRRGQRR